MPDLTEFLLARIAEDEAAAMRCSDHPDPTAYARDNYGLLWVQPARVLAECEAKRRIVERYDPTLYGAATIIDESGEQWEHLTDDAGFLSRDQFREHQRTLRLLALPYADHPDYDESWKP